MRHVTTAANISRSKLSKLHSANFIERKFFLKQLIQLIYCNIEMSLFVNFLIAVSSHGCSVMFSRLLFWIVIRFMEFFHLFITNQNPFQNCPSCLLPVGPSTFAWIMSCLITFLVNLAMQKMYFWLPYSKIVCIYMLVMKL